MTTISQLQVDLPDLPELKGAATGRRWIIGRQNNSQPRHPVASVDQQPLSGIRVLVGHLEAEAIVTTDLADSIRSALDEVVNGEASDYASGDGATDESAVAFAVLRRISRESVHIADPIESVARTIGDRLALSTPPDSVLRIGPLDHADRLSLKLLVRTMIHINRRYPDVGWEWHFDTDIALVPGSDVRGAVRHDFLNRIASTLQPMVTTDRADRYDPHIPEATGPSSVLDLSNNVVLQNYDHCLFDPPTGATRPPEDGSSQHRLRAIALVNVGRWQDALDEFAIAVELSDVPSRRAMIHYLRSLVLQKRYRNGDEGLHALDEAESCLDGVERTPDVLVEAAWCKNGRALHEVLQWRADRDPDRIERAVGLVSEAFWLITDETDPAAVYLRNNLLANMAFLFEMTGEYREAIQLFRGVFGDMLDLHSGPPSPYRTTLCYRIGLLESHDGNHDEAISLLQGSVDSAEALGSLFSLERILRGLGFTYRQASADGAAAEAHSRGLALAYDLLSPEGYGFHRDALQALAAGDKPPRPSPKLPAYFPEFDLEDVPPTRLNDHLVGSAER